MSTIDLAVPNIFVRDFPRALAYYNAALGFATQFTYGTPAFYAHVHRNRVKLALRHVDGEALDHGAGEDLLSAWLEVTGVDALFADMQAAGATIHQPPRDQPYGVRDFIVADPDGNLLGFGQDLPRA